MAGYGAGAAIFNPIFAYLIHMFDYRATFLYTGIASGIIMILAGAVSAKSDARGSGSFAEAFGESQRPQPYRRVQFD